MLQIVARFNETGFPCTLGAVDGTHVPILAPKKRNTAM